MATLKHSLHSVSARCPLWLKQAVKFLAVGVLNTALDVGLYFVLTRWLGLGTLKVLAKSISYGVGILNSFYWNKSWTFQVKAKATLPSLAVFALSNLIALGINAGVMQLGLSVLSLHETLALVMATGITFLWNFMISKYLVFRQWSNMKALQ